jgi:NADPH:quinone reductase-like Zn-dependent oxidoreductase
MSTPWPPVRSAASTSPVSPTRAELEALADLTAAGKLRITIDAEIPLADAPAAVHDARFGHVRGKRVILLRL